MCLREGRIKDFIIVIFVISAFLFLHLQDSIADTVSIKGAMKIHRMGGYVILINYETRDKWTDNILLKVHCEFEETKLTFTSSAMNNIERGWHKTQISISEVIRKRYGSLRKYKIELYKSGILVDERKSY
ncbi:MAG: hypothetical protein KKD90_01480 [Candidatus Omnitrophica bacterium]|nr:hypothetical protein [Candidatus Omnitrophota bacterium]MBU4149430.1 hypothetical protein [Candidatus Omnitrophota bacterium]